MRTLQFNLLVKTKVIWILVLNALQLRTLFGLFNFFGFERYWWVFCRRNARLAYMLNLVLVSMMSLWESSTVIENKVFPISVKFKSNTKQIFSLFIVVRIYSGFPIILSTPNPLNRLETRVVCRCFNLIWLIGHMKSKTHLRKVTK